MWDELACLQALKTTVEVRSDPTVVQLVIRCHVGWWQFDQLPYGLKGPLDAVTCSGETVWLG